MIPERQFIPTAVDAVHHVGQMVAGTHPPADIGDNWELGAVLPTPQSRQPVARKVVHFRGGTAVSLPGTAGVVVACTLLDSKLFNRMESMALLFDVNISWRMNSNTQVVPFVFAGHLASVAENGTAAKCHVVGNAVVEPFDSAFNQPDGDTGSPRVFVAETDGMIDLPVIGDGSLVVAGVGMLDPNVSANQEVSQVFGNAIVRLHDKSLDTYDPLRTI